MAAVFFNSTNLTLSTLRNSLPGPTDRPWPYASEPYSLMVSRLIFVSMIATIGLTCNILVVVQISRRIHKPPVEYYIRNLAISDLGVIISCFPIAIIREQLPHAWPLGQHMCKWVYPLTEVFYAASVWSIAAIATERYHVIRRTSMTQKGILTGARWRVIAIWCLSFVLTSLPLFFIMEYRETPQDTQCRFAWPSWAEHSYVISLTILEYPLPLGIITYTYIHISKVLKESSAFHKRSVRLADRYTWGIRKFNATEARRLKENARARKILTPLVLVFAISMFPLNALRIISLLWEGTTQWRYFLVLYNFSVIAIVFNSSADPIIYFIASKAIALPAVFGHLARALRRASKRDKVKHNERDCEISTAAGQIVEGHELEREQKLESSSSNATQV